MKNIISSILKALVTFIFRIKVYGTPPIQNKDKGLLFVSNHESFLDGLILGLFLKNYKPVFIVHTTVVNNWLFKIILSLTEYYTVDPTSPLSMKHIIKLINTGRNVVIFPEGRITTTGSLMKVYDGTAFVAYKTEANIIPVRLMGPQFSLFSRMSKNHPKKFFPKISLTFLPSVTIKEPAESSASAKRIKAGVSLKHIMEEMLFTSTNLNPIYDTFVESMNTFGKNTKIAEDIRQNEFSYKDINLEILAISRFIERQTKEGDFICLLLPNLITTFSIFVSVNSINRVPCLLNYTSGLNGIKSSIETVDSNFVITSRRFLETAKITELFQNILNEKNLKVIYLEDLKQSISFSDKLYALFNNYVCNLHKGKSTIESIATIIFTSGSEGVPKGVALSHKAILSNVAQVKSIISFNTEDKVFNALPMFHSFGLTAGTILPIVTGTKIFLYPSPLHYKIIPEIVYDRGCTILFGTNSFLNKYAQYANPHDFYSLKYVIAGAEKLSQSTSDLWFDKFGIRILEGYGATELAPIISVNTPTAYKRGTVGRLLPGISHYLQKVEGIDSGGQLFVKAPNLMSGYIKNEKPKELQINQSQLGAEWYDTGDIVEIDESGFVKICGRSKRFAKIAGEMVALDNTEKIANLYSPNNMHASISIPDKSKGESIVLYTTDEKLVRSELLNSCKSLGFTELTLPSKIIYLEVLPLLGTGKVDYISLKKMQ